MKLDLNVFGSIDTKNFDITGKRIEIDKEELATETSQNIESVDNSESINIEETINSISMIGFNSTFCYSYTITSCYCSWKIIYY